MTMRRLYAIAAVALCLALLAGSATASGATATLTVNGGVVAPLHISGAPSGLYTVYELTDSGYVLVGTGEVGSSGESDSLVSVFRASNPSFQVRLRTSDGLVLIAVAVNDPNWWWDS
jgi:hypothetical protein